METAAVALFTATFAVIVGYAARRRRILSWIPWKRTRSVKLKLEGETLEVTGANAEEQTRLIEEFLRQHAEGTAIRGEAAAKPAAPGGEVRGVEISEIPGAVPQSVAGVFSNVRMIHVITLIFLLTSLWIILSNRYDDDVQKWAFGAMGSVLGFWLGPGRD